MQVSSKMLYKTAIMMLGLLLVLGVFVAFTSTQKADALTSTQWSTVRSYVDSYISNQYVSTDEGEAGFYVDQAALKARLDSNNDGVYLGEGDNAANAPVLVDNLEQLTTLIPQTAFRCKWNDGSCFTSTSLNSVKAIVNNHESAGFSTDVIDYCQTDHTAAPTTGAFGYIAQTGALGGSSTPNVYGFKWGRNGWTDTVASYSHTNGTGAAGSLGGPYSYATNPSNCDSSANDEELVACIANWGISSTGGNVGNGKSPPLTATQIVDIRADSPAATIPGAVQIPIDTIFNTGLSSIDPSQVTLVASRTQGPGGIVAEGLSMLGYSVNTGSGGGFLNSGMPNWDNTMDEKQVSTGNSYPLDTVSALTAPAVMDAVAPTITDGPTVSNITPTSADIGRIAGEPATSKIDLVGSDASEAHVNDTVLNANKTATGVGPTTVSGLNAGVTYTGTLDVCDSQANCTSAAVSFTTESCAKPDLNLSIGGLGVYWASMADYTNHILSIDYNVNNGGTNTAYNVQLTGSSANNGVTVNSGIPVTVGTISGGGSGGVPTVTYDVPVGVGSFWVSITASAEDACTTSYTYP